MSDPSRGPLENTKLTVSYRTQYLTSSLWSWSMVLLAAPVLFKVSMATGNLLGQQMSNTTPCIYDRAKVNVMYVSFCGE